MNNSPEDDAESMAAAHLRAEALTGATRVKHLEAVLAVTDVLASQGYTAEERKWLLRALPSRVEYQDHMVSGVSLNPAALAASLSTTSIARMIAASKSNIVAPSAAADFSQIKDPGRRLEAARAAEKAGKAAGGRK